VIDIGYDSHNAVLILGTTAMILFLYVVKIMLICILKPMTHCCKGKFYTGWLYKKLYSGLFFNDLLTILFETFIEFLIAGYMNYKYPLNTYRGEKLG